MVCFGGWIELGKNEPFILDRPKRVDDFAILSRQPNGNLFYLDTEVRILRVKRINGSVLEFNSEHLRGKNMIKKTLKDKDARHKLFSKEPVLWGISNMKSFSKGVVLFHRVNVPGRAVQFVDENLKVIQYWEDSTLRSGLRLPEAAAVTPEGQVIALGEEGEILKYDMDGSVVERLVLPGLFNESRTAKANPYTQEKLMYSDTKLLDMVAKSDAARFTKAMQKRDRMLPSPIFLSGPEMPSLIKALEVTDDGHIFAMDDFKIYDAEISSATIRLLNLPNLEFNENEKLLGMRVKGRYLSIMTKLRVITLMLKPAVIGEKTIPRQFAYDKLPWDFMPPKDFGTFFFSDEKSPKIREIKID
jgi:hypothetical protein